MGGHMSGVLWWLAERLSRVLEAGEREAVIGDIAESGATGTQALRDVLGLIVRRNGRVWLALAALTGQAWALLIFVGMPLRAFDIWWKYGVRNEDGLSVGQDLMILTCHCAALICYSWTSSFALTFFSRHKIRINALLLCLVWLFAVSALTTPGMPLHSTAVLVTLEALLVVIPSLGGMRQAFGIRAIGPSQIALLTSATAITAALAIWTSAWSASAIEVWSEGQIRAHFSWVSQVLLPFAILNWPVAYLAMNARNETTRSVLSRTCRKQDHGKR